MDKRTIIALVLIFVVFWLSNELIWKKRVPEVQPQEQPTLPAVERQVPQEQTRTSDTLPDREEVTVDGLIPARVGVNHNILLSDDKVTLSFSNHGGVINEVNLHNYFISEDNSLVNLIPDGGSLLGLTLNTDYGSIDLSKQVFNWEKSEVDGYPSLLFYLESEQGRAVEKRFILADDYRLLFNIYVRNLGETDGYKLAFASGITDTEKSLKQKETDYQVIAQVQGVKRAITLRALNRAKERESIAGNINWAAVRSKYFIKILIPEEQLQTDYLSAFANNGSPSYELYVKQGRVGTVIDNSYQLYLGPLIYENLKSYGIGLEETVELGWKVIRPLGRFFLWVLTSINKLIPNYGITIIIFALLLKIVLYPLTHKSFHSMQKMQKIQPYMQEIQRKYKQDPKKMQEELSKLYKEHGTNPMSGCLTLLPQMPIFFALYPVLRYSIELRQASFAFWITDLSEPDSLMILPILMGLFMFVQQKMSTPKAIDPEKMDEKQLAAIQSQKMMLYIMPVFMVFIFRGLPSGLVLYWTIFNVFSIIQQYFVKKQLSNNL